MQRWAARAVLSAILVLLSGIPAKTAASGYFDDLSGHATERQAILRMVQQGIVEARSTAKFAPDEPVTRGEFVTSLQRLFALPPVTPRTPITDLSPDSPLYAAAAATAPYMGRQVLCPGCALGTNFLPNLPITRAEETIALVDILVATGRLQLLDGAAIDRALAKATDAGQIFARARPYFATAVAAGVLALGPGNRIAPEVTPSRADVALVLDRVQQSFAIPLVSPAP